eukprot:3344212-Prymnesium_polylepis.1
MPDLPPSPPTPPPRPPSPPPAPTPNLALLTSQYTRAKFPVVRMTIALGVCAVCAVLLSRTGLLSYCARLVKRRTRTLLMPSAASSSDVKARCNRKTFERLTMTADVELPRPAQPASRGNRVKAKVRCMSKRIGTSGLLLPTEGSSSDESDTSAIPIKANGDCRKSPGERDDGISPPGVRPRPTDDALKEAVYPAAEKGVVVDHLPPVGSKVGECERAVSISLPCTGQHEHSISNTINRGSPARSACATPTSTKVKRGVRTPHSR